MTLYRHSDNGTVIDCDDELAALIGPGWAKTSAAKVADATADPESDDADDGPPPKSGKGSSDANWTAYARAHGVEVTDAMKRAEVIAACEAASIPTE